jgi:crossover junction endodeoxyribonuclease RuvC
VAGIDPGLDGAVFFLALHDPADSEAVDLPIHLLLRGGKKKRELDVLDTLALLSNRPIVHAFLEQVGPMPGQGVSSVFSFGKTYGVILGVIAAHAIPLTLVAPVSWKRALNVPKAKDGARARASQLLPAAAQQWSLARHHGRAEAALLALYGARTLGGGP